MKSLTIAVIVSFAASQQPRALAAQASLPVLTGQVTDSAGQPLVNAIVRLLGTNHLVLTNPQGRYEFRSIPDGVYTVRAQYIGFTKGQRDSVHIVQGTTLEVDFHLRLAPCDSPCSFVTFHGKS